MDDNWKYKTGDRLTDRGGNAGFVIHASPQANQYLVIWAGQLLPYTWTAEALDGVAVHVERFDATLTHPAHPPQG